MLLFTGGVCVPFFLCVVLLFFFSPPRVFCVVDDSVVYK